MLGRGKRSGLGPAQPSPAHPARLPAVHSDGVVACLLLLLLHSCDEVDHALALDWHSDLGPAMEVELPDCAGCLLLAARGL